MLTLFWATAFFLVECLVLLTLGLVFGLGQRERIRRSGGAALRKSEVHDLAERLAAVYQTLDRRHQQLIADPARATERLACFRAIQEFRALAARIADGQPAGAVHLQGLVEACGAGWGLEEITPAAPPADPPTVPETPPADAQPEPAPIAAAAAAEILAAD